MDLRLPPVLIFLALAGHARADATFLAIDDHSLPLHDGLCLYLSAPAVRAEPVLTPSRDNPHATDTMAAHFYGTVLHEGGRFRMWYYGASRSAQDRTATREGPVCYAESADGLHWTKPKLGQVSFHGGSDNNALALPGERTEGAFVLREDGDPDPTRRYKMIYEDTSALLPIVRTAVSPDGIVWKGTGIAAHVVEPSSFYHFKGLYAFSGQTLGHSEGGHQAGRQGLVWVSPDFEHWLQEAGEAFLPPEPSNPNQRGHARAYKQVHLGVGAVSFGNGLVGLYGQWHARPQPGDWFGHGTTYGDLGLLVSNDGLHFREPVKGFVYLDRHRSPAAIAPDIRAEEVLVQSGNGILNVGNETWIYHGRWMNAEKEEDSYGEVALATLPRDRWGALGLFPGATEGTVWSAPVRLGKAGNRLALNLQGAAGFRVELADEQFRLLPEYSGEGAGRVEGDGLASPVVWPKAQLDAAAGRSVRLLIHLRKAGKAEPRLFAVYVSSGVET